MNQPHHIPNSYNKNIQNVVFRRQLSLQQVTLKKNISKLFFSPNRFSILSDDELITTGGDMTDSNEF